MSRNTLLLVSGLALLLTLGLTAGGALVSAKPDAAAVVYETAPVTKGEIRKFVATTGTVRPRMTVQVGSELSGRVKSITTDFNARVKAGDLLAVIEPKSFESKARQAKADVQSAEAAVMSAEAAVKKWRSIVTNAEKAFGRQRLLDQKGIAAGSAVDTSERDLNVAKAEVEVAQANLANATALVTQKVAQHDQAIIDLDRTQIRAPIDGIVLHRAVDVGQTVAASFQAPELFRLAGDLASVHIEAQVGESDIGAIKRDQSVSFDVDAHPKRIFAGRVEQIRLSPAAADSVVVYTVIIEADNVGLDLFPGMTANVRIETARLDDVIRLPADAIRFKPPKSAGAGGNSFWQRGPVAALRSAGRDNSFDPGRQLNEKSMDATESRDVQIQRWTRRLKLDEKQVAAIKAAAKPQTADGDGGKGDDKLEEIIATVLTTEQRAKLEAIQAEREGTQRATVWALDKDGQPKKQSVRIGLADTRYVELASKELKPGDEIVVRSRKQRSP